MKGSFPRFNPDTENDHDAQGYVSITKRGTLMTPISNSVPPMMPPEVASQREIRFSEKAEARRDQVAGKIDQRRAKIERHAGNADPAKVEDRLERFETKSSERMERVEEKAEKRSNHASNRIDVFA